MRIEYDLTEPEYVEAVLAAAQPPVNPTTRRPGLTRRIATLLGICVLSAAPIFLIVLLLPEWRRSLHADGWDALWCRVGRIEWILPYAAYSAIILTFAVVPRHGLFALRVAVLLLTLAFVALLALVAAAALFANDRMLLADFGLIRVVPWIAPAMVLFVTSANAWTGRHARRAYAASPYRGASSTLIVDENGVTNLLPTVTTLWRWTAFTYVRRTRHLVLLMIAPTQIGVIVPKRSLGSAAEIDSFVDAVTSRIAPANRAFAVGPHVAE